MKFSELLKKETYGAFKDYVSMQEAKSSGTIPEDYHTIFSDTCVCRSEMIISKELTIVQCCNPRCYLKLGHMLDEMLTRFGVKGIGPTTCISSMKEMVSELDIPSHLELFQLDSSYLPGAIRNYKFGEFECAKSILFGRKYTLAELVPKLGLPGLGNKAQVIFEDYSSIVELEEVLDDIPGFLATKGIYSEMVAYNLRTYLPDIILSQLIFLENMRNKSLQTIDIVMTGNLSPYNKGMPKNKFIESLNEAGTMSNGVSLFDFRSSSAVKSVPYIVSDYASGTSKYKIGKDRGVLITSTDLLNQVKELVKGAEESV